MTNIVADTNREATVATAAPLTPHPAPHAVKLNDTWRFISGIAKSIIIGRVSNIRKKFSTTFMRFAPKFANIGVFVSPEQRIIFAARFIATLKK